MVASTTCWLSSSTRNIVPGSTTVTLPSTSMCCSFMDGRPAIGTNRKTTRRSPVLTEPRLEIPIRLIAMATATATAVFTATTAAGGCAFFTRLGNAYGEGASSHILAVKGLNGLLRFLVRAHGHESKAARTIGHAIHYQVGFRDRAMRGERVSHLIFSGFQGKASDKQFIVHLIFYCPTNRCFLQPVPERRVQNHH